MPEYLISQHDPRGERAEQLAAVKAAHAYNLEYGFPVAAGRDDGNGPSESWQLKAIEEQELIRANLVALRRRGRWDFVNDLQPLAPRRVATMVHENDVGGLIDYFMPVLGGRKSLDRTNSLKEFQDIFAIIKPPEVVGRSESDEYFAEMMVAGAGPDAINPNGRRAREVPDHLRSPAECA